MSNRTQKFVATLSAILMAVVGVRFSPIVQASEEFLTPVPTFTNYSNCWHGTLRACELISFGGNSVHATTFANPNAILRTRIEIRNATGAGQLLSSIDSGMLNNRSLVSINSNNFTVGTRAFGQHYTYNSWTRIHWGVTRIDR